MALPVTIKALQIQPGFTVKVVDIPFADQDKIKNLPDNEILVKVRAAGINPTDWKHSIVDLWGTPGKIVGCDAAGDVVKVGKSVKHVKEGDRVWAFTHGSTEDDNGAYAEYCRFCADAAFVLPAGMSYAEAAAFPIPHLTAVQSLYFRHTLPFPSQANTSGSNKPNFFVWGGSGSVGHHAIQLAHLSGYRVITTASKENSELLKSLGADVVIDYKASDVLDQIKAAVKDGGLKYAFDTICAKGSTDIIIDAITNTNGAHITTTLPVSDATKNRRQGVKVEFLLVYTLVNDKDFIFARNIPIKAVPEDHVKSLKWVSEELPKLLEGWKEGEGNARYKGQKLTVAQGLDKIGDGLHSMKEGKVKGKLVYLI